MAFRYVAWLFVMCACGGASSGSGGGVSPTSAQPAKSLAFKGEECHGAWQRPKDSKGRDLPWDSTEGTSGAAWTKGSALPDAPKEKLVLDLICFDAIATSPSGDETFKRYLRFDDRRFDPTEAAILIDECVENGTCTKDEVMASLLAWHGHELAETRLSAASKKLEISQEARDAFVDRTLASVQKIDAFLASLTPPQRTYLVDIPKSIHDARALYFKGHEAEYTRLDRILEKPDITALTVLRSDAATQCGTAQKCSNDPLYREVSRLFVHTQVTGNRPLEAKAAELALGPVHAGRGTTASQIWASQTAYRKLHPDMKPPAPVTEEAPDETAAIASGIEVARAEVASIAPAGHGVSKVSFKDSVASKRCEETADIDGFDGAIEQTRVLYKQACSDVAAGVKTLPFLVADGEGSGVKPGAVVVAAVAGTGAARKGVIAQVLVSDKIVQLGPDKFVATSGDPLKGQP